MPHDRKEPDAVVHADSTSCLVGLARAVIDRKDTAASALLAPPIGVEGD
jgi:hypothetical protein